MNIQYWLEVYKNSPEDSELKKLVLEHIITLNPTFKDLHKVYKDSTEEERELVLKYVALLLPTFREWLIICYASQRDSKHLPFILENVVKMAHSFEEWNQVYCIPDNKELSQLALEKMASLAQSFEEWSSIRNKASSGSELKKLSLENMAKLAQSIQEWQEVAFHSAARSELNNLARKKLGRT